MNPNSPCKIVRVKTSLVIRQSCGCFEKSVQNAGKKIERLRNINSSLSDELYEVKSGSRVTELEEQLEELRSLRDRTTRHHPTNNSLQHTLL